MKDKEAPKAAADRHSATWYEDAIFYEVSVKSFFDASGDGIGDFAGLTSKLDYIQDLGATCLWLLPFFPSPLRDDGYDVTDYRGVHPACGTVDDFRAFVKAAHDRGISIAAEMVVNHTSDQHPWFQAARHAAAGSSLRDYYVWSDSGQEFRNVDALPGHHLRNGHAPSHWTWDPQAKAFYWHRFDEHQPDLNYDNPAVRAEMLKVLRFWADLGVDGLCLNGAAFLAEREGTQCEHLPETHAVLKEWRQQLGQLHPNLMLQAGLNAWPSDARTYFGDGDECHMATHLALAQRLFLALRQEDRQPIADILAQTPRVPRGCQWVTLLRNHDELTLALATDEERDYLFREYAADPATRLRGGILKRLAALVENSRRRIELLFGLLFSLPGAPVIYYGDELGMGDNVFLGGRKGVRTPMQWTADRNAGFSTADFARLYCPPIMDPLFGHQAINVESQRRDPSSLLHWVRRLIAVRKRSRAFPCGTLEMLDPQNRKVIAFIRRIPASSSSHGSDNADPEVVLVVANLSRSAQPVELDLGAFEGLVPVEMFGRTAFPRIGSSPYIVTLGPHSFFWFQLQKKVISVTERLASVDTKEVAALPVVEASAKWEELFSGSALIALEQSILPSYLQSQRWFGGKAKKIEAVHIADWGPLQNAETGPVALFLEVRLSGGQRHLYFLPLATVEGAAANRLYESHRPLVIARLTGQGGERLLCDALADDAFCSALVASIGGQEAFSTHGGQIHCEATAAFRALRGEDERPLAVKRGPATSSNSLVFFGRRLLFKLFRRLEIGVNPDYEVGRFLTDERHFDRIPPVAGTITYQSKEKSGAYTLGILQALVPNQGDGWGHAVDELGRYYDRAASRMWGPDPVPPDARPLAELAYASPPLAALETIGAYLHAAAMLGRRTAEMHLALAAESNDPDFAPQPLDEHDLRVLQDDIARQGQQALSALQSNLDRLPATIAADAQKLLEVGPHAIERLAASWQAVPRATKTRIHGDYHLGQVLWVDNDYVILDFEGEPTRTVDQRRAKFSPIRDIAGMLRSYHYAAYAGLFAFTQDRPQDLSRLASWADLWQQWVSAAFLQQYLATAGGASFLPSDRDQFAGLLDGFMLAKALYELVYELNNRPDWVRIPLGGVLRLLASETDPSAAFSKESAS